MMMLMWMNQWQKVEREIKGWDKMRENEKKKDGNCEKLQTVVTLNMN